MPKVRQMPMPGMSRMQMPNQSPNTTLNPVSFQSLIESQGIRMIHQRPVPCPNIRSLDAPAHESTCEMCFNGNIYFDTREFIGAAMADSLDRRFGNNGTWDLDQAQIIVPTQDLQGRELDVNYFDQITLPDFTVRYYQRIEHSQTGIDRLQFRPISLDYVIDGSGKQYRVDVDVKVEDGRLKWIGDRPGYDAFQRRGKIYSVSYYIVPTFTVVAMPHQLRMAQTKGVALGTPNVQARFPQLVVVRRDFIPFDSSDKDGSRDRPEPQQGSM
jgi:hypothetical protein